MKKTLIILTAICLVFAWTPPVMAGDVGMTIGRPTAPITFDDAGGSQNLYYGLANSGGQSGHLIKLETFTSPNTYTNRFKVDKNGNVTAAGIFYGDGSGLTNISMSAHAHSAVDITSGTLLVGRGGTGATTLTSGNVLIGAGTGAITTLSRSGIDNRATFPPETHFHSAVDITSGTLLVGRGGTGATTLTSGNVLIGAGTSAITTLARNGIDSRATFPPATHLHSAADITSGTFGDARITSATTWNAKIGGSGTLNYIPKFTAVGTIGNSIIFDNGVNVGIGTTNPSLKLHVQGSGPLLSTSNYYHVVTNSGSTGQGILLGYHTEPNGGGMIAGDGISGRVNNLVFVGFNGTVWGERMRLLGNGNLGIGTPAPGNYRIYGRANVASDWAYRFDNDSNSSNIHVAHGGGYGLHVNAGTNASASTYILELSSNNTSRMMVRGDGNVGIGNSSPSYKLDVSGNSRIASGDNSYTYYGPNASWSGSLYVGATTNKLAANTAHVISTNGNLHLDSANDTGKALYLQLYSLKDTYINAGGGNVGIGTASPNHKLHIEGNVRINGSGGCLGYSCGISFGPNNNLSQIAWCDGCAANGLIAVPTLVVKDSLRVDGGDGNASSISGGLRVLSNSISGVVAIKGHSAANPYNFILSHHSGSSAYNIMIGNQVEHNGSNWVARCEQSAGTCKGVLVNIGRASGGGAMSIENYTGGTNGSTVSLNTHFYMTDTGYFALGNGTTASYRLQLPNTASVAGRGQANSWVTYSSKRWKTDIQDISGALNKVMNLRGVYYRPKDSDNDNRMVGFIAEEVGEILPEAVEWEDDGVYAKSLDYDRISVVLVEAVKEQQKQIEELKAEIEKLKKN